MLYGRHLVEVIILLMFAYTYSGCFLCEWGWGQDAICNFKQQFSELISTTRMV